MVETLADRYSSVGETNSFGGAALCVYNGKKRHIRLRHKVLKEFIASGVISLDYVKSEKNLADPLTKGLCKKMVHETAAGMGLRRID